jgi:adenosylcobyric acid synthase
LRNVGGHLNLPGAPAVAGYEIHQGVSRNAVPLQAAVNFADGRRDGAISADGQILATYCHGLFDHPEALAAQLAWAGAGTTETVDIAARRAADLERLADAVEQALDLERLRQWLPF